MRAENERRLREKVQNDLEYHGVLRQNRADKKEVEQIVWTRVKKRMQDNLDLRDQGGFDVDFRNQPDDATSMVREWQSDHDMQGGMVRRNKARAAQEDAIQANSAKRAELENVLRGVMSEESTYSYQLKLRAAERWLQ